MNMNSGLTRRYRAKFVEINKEATGANNYFKEVSNPYDINVTISYPYFKGCPS